LSNKFIFDNKRNLPLEKGSRMKKHNLLVVEILMLVGSVVASLRGEMAIAGALAGCAGLIVVIQKWRQ
jgi:hypothetical protein